MKIVSLITARGGSKGIPNKNLVSIGNYPLIYYTIKASIDSNVDETWVSTDCENIAAVSKEFGANVIMRPDYLSNDIIMPDAALIHFAEKKHFDKIVFIQPTSPLLSSEFINEGILKSQKCDSVFSAYKEHWQPRWTKKSKPINWSIENRPRRQDVEEVYVENGAFYITTKTQLLSSKLRYSGNIEIVEMPHSLSFQLDSKDDLKILEKMLC